MNTTADSFTNRFNNALNLRNIKPVELAEKTGISKSTISHYMSGYTKPKSDKLFILAKALDVSETWLMGYDVPINRMGSCDVSIEYDATNLLKHTKNEEILLNHFSKLNLKGEEEAIKRVYELSMIKEYTDAQEIWLKEVPDSVEKNLADTLDISSLKKNDETDIVLSPLAAHERTDIEITDEMKQNDRAIIEKVKRKYRK